MNTKMLYHRDNRNTHEEKSRTITLVVVIALSVFVLVVAPVRNFVTQGIYLVVPQMWAAKTMVSERFNSLSATFRENGALFEENKALHDEVNRMQAQVLDRNLLAERVVALEGALGRAQGDDRVVAFVFSADASVPYDVLVLDAGSNNGIAKGDVVVLAGSGAIGEIIEVSDATSKAKLYSTSGVEVPAKVGSSAIPILAIGRGMGNFEAKVPEDSRVTLGDSVVSSKGNLILGVISFIEEKPAEPFKRIYFRQPFNITEIQSVEVVISNRS